MDKSLNSEKSITSTPIQVVGLNLSSKLPWWMILIQVAPLILQLLGEILGRSGFSGPSGPDVSIQSDVDIPPPLEVKIE